MIKTQLDRINVCLRRMCGKLTPKKRLIMILALCVIFGIGSIYMTVSSICNIGRHGSGKKYLEPEHIKGLQMQAADSIKHLNMKEYEIR